jgi:membrane protein implicated in regulation of membrane protease activity
MGLKPKQWFWFNAAFSNYLAEAYFLSVFLTWLKLDKSSATFEMSGSFDLLCQI